MTTERAIELIKYIETFDGCDYGATKIALDIAVEALEKKVPKRVNISSWSPARCPSCGEYLSESLGDGYYNHFEYLKICPNEECCQRLVWE